MILPYQLCDISGVLTQNKYYRSHPRYRIPTSVILCLLWRDMLFRFGRMASALRIHALIPRKTYLLSALHSIHHKYSGACVPPFVLFIESGVPRKFDPRCLQAGPRYDMA
jgi:hypothetical protein